MKKKVVVTDHRYPDLQLERQRFGNAGIELVSVDSTDEANVAEAVADADAVITCLANISAEVIRGMAKCRIISKSGIGIDNIDVAQATRQGIQVLNVPDYCIEEVSDTTVALALTLARRIPFLWNNVRNGDWSIAGCEGITRLRGKVFGFLGFGQVARRAAEKIKPFGMEIIANRASVQIGTDKETGARYVDFDTLIREADILSLNLPLTAETKGVINRDVLQKMKKTALLVNTSRGALVDEDALFDAIKNGEIAGAGLDVVCDEAYNPDNTLFRLSNVIITPHCAYYSTEATLELREKQIADVMAVLAGKPPKYPVNRLD